MESPQRHPLQHADSTSSAVSDVSTSSSVSFCSVVVHEHPIIWGGNSTNSSGPHLTIGWERLSEESLTLDDYEAARPLRRAQNELYLNGFARQNRLRKLGYTDEMLSSGVEYVEELRRQQQEQSTSWKSKLRGVLARKKSR